VASIVTSKDDLFMLPSNMKILKKTEVTAYVL